MSTSLIKLIIFAVIILAFNFVPAIIKSRKNAAGNKEISKKHVGQLDSEMRSDKPDIRKSERNIGNYPVYGSRQQNTAQPSELLQDYRKASRFESEAPKPWNWNKSNEIFMREAFDGLALENEKTIIPRRLERVEGEIGGESDDDRAQDNAHALFLRENGALATAVVMAEILGKPVSMRDGSGLFESKI